MTHLDPLADALAATSLRSDTAIDAPNQQPSSNPAKASFASALLAGQNPKPAIVTRDADSPSITTASAPSAPSSEPSSSDAPLVPIDDTILQAMRKRDDRIFFSQYENQMSAFVRDTARSRLELGSMNAYQRLLIHRCADQFQLEHHLDRATHCITLSKTPATTHPSALLSVRAREQIVQRDGIDPVNIHPNIASLAGNDPGQSAASSPSPSASTSSPSSPALAPASIASSAAGTPKGTFKIMRRDPSNSRQSRLRSAENDMSDSEKSAAKARKDMTLEEREASYKAARARIFGDLAANSGSTSPTDSSTQLDQTKEDAAKASPSSSAASSPVASIAGGGGRSGRSKKVPSSSSSIASQDGSTQRIRGSGSRKGGANQASDGLNDDLEFSRALPVGNAFGCLQQSSPLALPGHMTQGYFPPSQLQQSHSNPNLRSRAPVFHPQGSSTPSYAQGGALRYPDLGLQQGQVEVDAFPALSSPAGGSSRNGVNGGQQVQRNNSGGAWNRSQTGQEHLMNGVNAWAQQTSNYAQGMAGQRLPQQSQPAVFYPQQQYQLPHPALTPHYTQQPQGYGFAPNAGSRSANSSRASSQRNAYQGGRAGSGARDDAVSVSSISSAASSRSASFSGSVAGSTTQPSANGNGGGNSKAGSTSGAQTSAPALSHPSLPARPAWLSPQ